MLAGYSGTTDIVYKTKDKMKHLTLSWRGTLSYRNQSWTGFYMITASVMKELRKLPSWIDYLKLRGSITSSFIRCLYLVCMIADNVTDCRRNTVETTKQSNSNAVTQRCFCKKNLCQKILQNSQENTCGGVQY